jgi:hypothetical protein
VQRVRSGRGEVMETRRIKVKHIISGNGPFLCSGCDFYSSDVTRAAYHDGMVSQEDVIIGEDGFVKDRKALSISAREDYEEIQTPDS